MGFKVEQNELDVKNLAVEESLYSIANGYLGIRGNFEEGYDFENIKSIKGTYINAYYEDVDLQYAEIAYGFPTTMQKLVNTIDSQSTYLIVNGDEKVYPMKSYHRQLNMKKGYTSRSYIYETKDKKSLKVTYNRMVSFVQRECAVYWLEIEPITYKGEVKVVSSISGNVQNYTGDNDDPRVGNSHAKLLDVIFAKNMENDIMAVSVSTKESKIVNNCYAKVNSLTKDILKTASNGKVENTYTLLLDQKVMFCKYCVYTDSIRHKDVTIGKEILEQISKKGINEMLKEQEEYLDKFWKTSDICIDGEDSLVAGMRFNLYHLLQSVGKDKYSNIAAKGLSGEGYEGHYFWDTEIFIFPFFLLTNRKIAKNLLMYRYNILDGARKRAIQMGHKKGALFPWRTINGNECSSYFPAGTAQYHISGDIAYAFISYYLMSEDIEFFKRYGIDVLVETARLWLDVGHEKNGEFNIDCVTGPDEYTAIVNNNFYTNSVAKYNLYWANKLLLKIKQNDIDSYKEIIKRLELTEDEVSEFKKISDIMKLPYDEKLDINPQDDQFLQKKAWDFENTPKENYPLLLHYHPLTIYRHQVLKQADVILSNLLLEDYSNKSTIKNNFDYYEKITTHDSSLSTSIYGMVACLLNDKKSAYEYFAKTVRLDLDNLHENTKDGLHMANMGGTYMYMVFGFLGLRIKEDGLHFNPTIPDDWNGYSFSLQYKEDTIKINVDKKKIVLENKKQAIKIYVFDKEYILDGSCEIDLGIELVIFDLDGVITDTAEYHYLAWKSLAKDLGIIFGRDFNENLKGVGRMDSLNRILKLGKIENKFNEEELQQLATKKNELYKTLIKKVKPDDILDGVLDAFKYLRKNNIKIVLGSASKNAPSILKSLEVEDYIDYIVSPDDIKNGKPAPDIFIAGAKHYNIDPKKTIVVEDAYSGVQAGKDAGMYVIGIGEKDVLTKADRVLKTTDLLLETFKDILK